MRSFITINNPTNFFYPTVSKSELQLSNPQLYSVTRNRIQGYEARLLYEWKETERLGGFAQFVTLTYNDKNIPDFYGIPCLRNSDIRGLLHDTRFFHDLERRQGYRFKYFVGAEFGEGKGIRGKGNNPHYHLILFFTPVPCWCKYDKRRVSRSTGEIKSEFISYPHLKPVEVHDAIIRYWQGSSKLRRNYNLGSVSFGSVDPYGVVQDFKAISYVSKYCIKDLYFKRCSDVLEKTIYSVLLERFPEMPSYEMDAIVEDELKRFNRNHCYRVLCSQGLGKSMISSIKDFLNPRVPVETNKGIINRGLPLYIYRKLYYDVKKDHLGNRYNCLNDLGLKYKCARLSEDLESLSSKTFENVNNLYLNSRLLQNYLDSDDRKFVYYFARSKISLKDFLLINNQYNKTSLFTLYALYKKIYEGRHFRYVNVFLDTPILDYMQDYISSLQDTHCEFFDSRGGVDPLFWEDVLPYTCHPDFKSYITLFAWFDDVNSYFTVQKDRQDKIEAEKRKQLQRIKNTITYVNN